MRLLILFISGVLFGTGLAISGMTDPQRVLSFLDVTGNWDPTLAFVMGGALAVFATGWVLLKKRGHGIYGAKLPDLTPEPISKSLIIGSALFGIGWALGGFCPGPAIANLAALRPEAGVFTATMLLGMFFAQKKKAS
ncbi:MAG: putative membrane protein YedE/YeeE [Verrucomicrobiales bacterium]|jgi:uncharacterized membrane protein YedE/YeeE